MAKSIFCSLMLCFLLIPGCSPAPAGKGKDFDTLRGLVQGKTAQEVERLLGPPDMKRPMLSLGQRWIWWSYTYLDGYAYSPDDRGKVVNFEVIFDPVGSTLRVTNRFAVDFSFPTQSALESQKVPYVLEG